MNKKIWLFSTTLVVIMLMNACSSPGILETEQPASAGTPLPLDTSSSGSPNPVPLPVDFPVVPTPALVFIDFQDRDNGWGLSTSGNGNILRTQDGGLTWLDVTPSDLSTVTSSTRLFLLDVNTAWALIPGEDFYSGTLYHSLDGGASWTSNLVPFSGGDMQFLDASTGRILADRGAGAGSNAVELYQTSDGGLTWISVFHNDPSQPGSSDTLPLGGMKSGVTFIDADTAWATGSRPMEGDIYLFVTRDGGISWMKQDISIPPDKIECQFNSFPPVFFGQDGFLPMLVYFYSGPVLQVFYVTHDGGNTWTADLDNASQVIVPAGQFAFADALHGFSWNGGPEIIRTIDGGQNWIRSTTSLDLSDSLGRIDFIDENIGWALTGPGDSGMAELYQTLDAGQTWSKLLP